MSYNKSLQMQIQQQLHILLGEYSVTILHQMNLQFQRNYSTHQMTVPTTSAIFPKIQANHKGDGILHHLLDFIDMICNYLTVTTHFKVIPFVLTVIVAFPFLTAVIFPLELTLATFVLEDLYTGFPILLLTLSL